MNSYLFWLPISRLVFVFNFCKNKFRDFDSYNSLNNYGCADVNIPGWQLQKVRLEIVRIGGEEAEKGILPLLGQLGAGIFTLPDCSSPFGKSE
jgi:hypothetical protein